ncbi:Clavaminate synthase-like protein [Laetiporus sulphureus 93-53]|uniref:Clavaminate synthase-like protein n=1 Tax=Laetiporus sulphureus 93-53 TaxID=1314785 RepID=A0A165F206_9APHY|nr:Clavaminate synthase-like protein [Laetiporus sulphureus 93-53]KZT08207.1 Clavaminate synthase-like protein [Laetiporus sulphureus 93-53]
MPSTVLPPVPHNERLPTTAEDLDWADIPIIDLANFGTDDGRAALAVQVRHAMSNEGFFYVINHGLTQAQNDRIFDIADVPFSVVPEDEKKIYTGDFEKLGKYLGYKARQHWHIDGGVHDQLEQYNIDRDVTRDEHPRALQPFLPELDAFNKFCHHSVLEPILRLLALGLELAEDTFVNIHGFDANNETSVRFIKYYPRSQEEEKITRNVWLKGHTDTGSVSILWSQPISALQMLSPDGKWRWVKHIDNAVVVNAGDVLEFLSGGFYKATIHRVVQPPVDQRGYPRVGVFYFAKTNDDVKLVPYTESPVLQEYGIKRRIEDADAPTMLQWRSGRARAYGISKLEKKENNIEEEVIAGVVVRHYN